MKWLGLWRVRTAIHDMDDDAVNEALAARLAAKRNMDDGAVDEAGPQPGCAMPQNVESRRSEATAEEPTRGDDSEEEERDEGEGDEDAASLDDVLNSMMLEVQSGRLTRLDMLARHAARSPKHRSCRLLTCMDADIPCSDVMHAVHVRG